MFRAAPAVVLVSGRSATTVTKAAGRAAALGIPLLLVGDGRAGSAAGPGGALARELDRLGARSVLALDRTARAAAERPTGPDVVTDPARLPAIRPPSPLTPVTVLVPAGDVPGMATGLAAAIGTARAAGARIQPVHSADPRADPTAFAALAALPPAAVIGLGPHFGPAGRLAARVATAATGVQLPGGGQVMFPGRRLVALYGNPYDSRLGALGQQDLPAAIDRAKRVARSYDALSDVPVVPTFEIIATVATAGAGPDGDYSAESSVADLKPWVDAATKAGLYVILDLQPGRASLLDQAQRYLYLLADPSVGLALDPEWKLGPGQLPLQQIGSVDAAEVNQVIDWLATLTLRHHLPQKLLVLHQFRLAMLRDEDSIDTRNDQVSVLIHMDGQGAPNLKDGTWRAVLAAAPPGVHFGWKNFYVKDTPMLSPTETMARSPQPVMISYQ
jgi:hypothetical protein